MYSIAIDGPAGSGKSTIARIVAEKLSFIYVDTGAMYRAMAVHFINSGIGKDESDKIAVCAPKAEVKIAYPDNTQHVYLNGEDITGLLRTEEVGEMASVSSAVPEVRQHLLRLQLNLAAENNVVMDGRDIGTKILPGADLKIYLTASVKVRAERRALQLKAANQPCDMAEIERGIEERDHRDMTRAESPLTKAEDAVLVDTSDMTIQEVADRIIDLFESRVR
ncbi:MAG: (d)CMP kinase [Clostridiales bacterium]|nr:(d)CMP kinase [Clostridiales bacterium]